MSFRYRLPRAPYVVLLALALVGCGVRRTPDLERIFADARARTGKRPIIVIPGILGSQLVNQRTGEVVWPSAFRSSTDGLSLPTTPDIAANRDGLVAARIVAKARLARLVPAEVYIYQELLDALARYGGYTEGDWENPGPDGDRDTFYVFPYDWRRDNVETAREFVRRVAELKRRLGRPDLRFNVVAHSMGGLVARYAAMYGGRDLPPEGVAPRPTWEGAALINKVFMFGTPNEGSAEAFATLLEGYSVTEGPRPRVRLLNKLSRDDAFTIPSLYQLLPHRPAARFLDENLEPLDLDIYDPSVWRRYGWAAINDTEYRELFVARRTRGEDPPPEGRTLEEADDYFVAVLARARQFHEALDAVGEAPPRVPHVQLLAFGGDCEETLAAPVILRDEKRGRWVTLTTARSFRTSTGREVPRREVLRAMFEPGDGRVTRRSLLGVRLGGARPAQGALYDTPLPLAYAVFVCDSHGDLQNNKTLQDNSLTLLISEMTK